MQGVSTYQKWENYDPKDLTYRIFNNSNPIIVVRLDGHTKSSINNDFLDACLWPNLELTLRTRSFVNIPSIIGLRFIWLLLIYANFRIVIAWIVAGCAKLRTVFWCRWKRLHLRYMHRRYYICLETIRKWKNVSWFVAIKSSYLQFVSLTQWI